MMRREGGIIIPGIDIEWGCRWDRAINLFALLLGLLGHDGLRGWLGCVAHSLGGGIQTVEVPSLNVSEPWGAALSDVRSPGRTASSICVMLGFGVGDNMRFGCSGRCMHRDMRGTASAS